MATLDQLFHHHTIKKIISRLRGPTHRMATFYGLMPGGFAVDDVGGANFGWDIFDRTRRVVSGRLRGAGPATAREQPVGRVDATVYRCFERTDIEVDKIFRNRRLGGPLGSLDRMGQTYMTRQVSHINEKFGNNRELMTQFMFQGGFELIQEGDDLLPVPMGTGGNIIEVNYRHPEVNRGGVQNKDGSFIFNTGGANPGWNDPNATIIDNLLQLNRHSAHHSRYPQQVAWLNGQTAIKVLRNKEVRETSGTANVVTGDKGVPNRLNFAGISNLQGQLSNIHSFTLTGYPAMTWLIYDELLTLPNGQQVEALPEGEVLFTPQPSDNWLCWKNGSEAVIRRTGGTPQEVFGMDFYAKYHEDPVRVALYGLDNGIPAPLVPQAWYRAKVYTPS